MKGEIQSEVELCLRTTPEDSQSQKIIEILLAFGIEVQSLAIQSPKNLDKEEDNVLLQDEDSRSNKSVSPRRFLEVPGSKNEVMKTLKIARQSYNDSELYNSARTSMNPYETIQGRFLKWNIF